jgi:DNA-binding MarR family transcriptional regulator
MARKSSPDTILVLRDLWALAHALEARSKRMQRTVGVTGPQRLVLRVIGDSPGCSPGETARHLHLHPGTVSRHVSSLIRAGLVRRTSDDDDARRQQLVLTRRGTALARNMRGTVEEAVRSALAATPGTEVEPARRLLGRITAGLSG